MGKDQGEGQTDRSQRPHGSSGRGPRRGTDRQITEATRLFWERTKVRETDRSEATRLFWDRTKVRDRQITEATRLFWERTKVRDRQITEATRLVWERTKVRGKQTDHRGHTAPLGEDQEEGQTDRSQRPRGSSGRGPR